MHLLLRLPACLVCCCLLFCALYLCFVLFCVLYYLYYFIISDVLLRLGGESMYPIREACIVSAEDKLDVVLKKLKEGVKTFVVMEGKKYLGIVTDTTIRSLQHDVSRKIRSIVWSAPTIKMNMKLEDVAERFVHGYRELPVVEDSKVLGLLKNTDLLKMLLEEGRIPKRRVSEIMSAPLISVESKTNVAQAAAIMRQNKIHHLAVTENGKFVNIISTSDLYPFLSKTKEKVPFFRERLGLDTIELRTAIPSIDLKTIRESAFLTEAAESMIKNDISTLLVFDAEGLGMIHAIDIIRASLPTVEPPFEIIGLEEEDKELRDDIRVEMINLLKKVERTFPIETSRLVIKKYRKSGERCKWSLKFMLTGKKRIAVDASDWNLFKAIHYIKEEVEKITKAEKEKSLRKRAGGRKRFSAEIQLGETYPGKPIK